MVQVASSSLPGDVRPCLIPCAPLKPSGWLDPSGPPSPSDVSEPEDSQQHSGAPPPSEAVHPEHLQQQNLALSPSGALELRDPQQQLDGAPSQHAPVSDLRSTGQPGGEDAGAEGLRGLVQDPFLLLLHLWALSLSSRESGHLGPSPAAQLEVRSEEQGSQDSLERGQTCAWRQPG